MRGAGWLSGADGARRERINLPVSVVPNLNLWLVRCASINSSAEFWMPNRSRRSVKVLVGGPWLDYAPS